ncbi:hypothetical protein [Bacillus mycoides]|uniref:hypothetical protein n=1 Tax=Bacillus mycoides TaxID=1405 RepID=UPI0002798C0D|nr:hypothetical protein [Bacillus mycoides]EJR92971.1 hypothetical protein IKM_06036 [Bacillus mycoides]
MHQNQQNYKLLQTTEASLIDKINVELSNLLKETPKNYAEMLRFSYGDSLYNLFFKPYNEKMFGIENLSSLQYGNFEKIRNVRLNQNQQGYNGDFIYPSGTQGAKAIPEKLSEGVNIEYNTELISLNLNKQQAVFVT